MAKFSFELSAYTLLITTAFCGVLTGQARAQQADEAPIGSAAVTQDIIVTASRRETRLLDVPISVSTVGGEQLGLTQTNSAVGTLQTIPSVGVSPQGGALLVTVRGVGLDTSTGLGESNVAQYIDGVYQPRLTSINLVFADLNRVEVLRGPQGTLYGRNATGGAINYITNQPGDEFEGGLEAGFGNYGSRDGKMIVSGPVSDVLSARAVAFYSKMDGYGLNLLTGNRIGGDESAGGRITLKATPSEALTLTGTVAYTNSDGGAPGVNGYTRGGIGNHIAENGVTPNNPTASLSPLTFGGGFVSRDRFRVYNRVDPKSNNRQFLASLTANLDLSDTLSVKSVTGFIDNSQHYFVDLFNAAIVAPVAVTPFDASQKSKSIGQEFTANARLFDGRVDLLAGAYYFREKMDGNILINFFGFGGVGAPPATPTSIFEQTITSKALFFDATIRVTDRFRILAGARQTWDNQNNNHIADQSGLCADPRFKLKFKNFSPKAGLQFDVSDDSMVYASYQKGFKAGGFNSFLCNNDYRQELITSYEAGLKARLFDGALTLTTSAFYYDYTDLQVQKFFGFQNSTVNAPKAKIKGGEVEFLLRPATGFQVDGSASVLDARFGTFETEDPAGLLPGLLNIRGNRPPRSPKFGATLGVQYRMELGHDNSITLRGEMQHKSRSYFTIFNREDESQKKYDIFNAYLNYGFSQHGSLKLFVKNIFDKEYINNAAIVNVYASDPLENAPGAGNLPASVGYGAPRTYGATIGWTF